MSATDAPDAGSGPPPQDTREALADVIHAYRCEGASSCDHAADAILARFAVTPRVASTGAARDPDAAGAQEAPTGAGDEQVCRHCGDPIRRAGDGNWAHIVGPGSILYNCQHTVPYGQVAEPAFTRVQPNAPAQDPDTLREENERLRADVARYRARIHEAVDECQRRYAPDVKALHELRACAEMARRDLERQGEDAIKWWSSTSQVARAFIVTTMARAEDAERERDALRERLAAVEALTRTHFYSVPVVTIQQALAFPVTDAPTGGET